MNTNEQFEIIPGQAQLSEPLFKSEREYENFRRSYAEQIAPELERLSEARRQSEEESKQHLMYCRSTTNSRPARR
jgi:hypothetical protein